MPARGSRPSTDDEAEEERVDRMRWTKAAQARFIVAVEHSGGLLQATPRAILDALGMDGVSYAQVKSHLQRYRTTHIAEKVQRGEYVGNISDAQLRASQALLDKKKAAGRRRPATSCRHPEPSLQPPSQRLRSVSELPAISGGSGKGPAAIAALQLGSLAAAAPEPVNITVTSGSTRSRSTGGDTGSMQPSSHSSRGHGNEAAGGRVQRAAAAGLTLPVARLGSLPLPASSAPPSLPTPTTAPATAEGTTGGTATATQGTDNSDLVHLMELLTRLQAMQAALELMQEQQQQILTTLQQHSHTMMKRKQGMADIQQQCLAAIAGAHAQREQQQEAAVASQPLPQLPPSLAPGPGNHQHLISSLPAISQMQQAVQPLVPTPQIPAIPSQQPAAQLPQPGSWQERLRVRLTDQSGSARQEGAFGPPPQHHGAFAPLAQHQGACGFSLQQQGTLATPSQPSGGASSGAAVPASSCSFLPAAPPQPQPQQPAQQPQLDETLAMLLGSFAPLAPVQHPGCGTGNDLATLLNSASGSAGGGTDSLLGSLLRAAGGQPGINDLAAMLSSL